jgi:hypothetical protein
LRNSDIPYVSVFPSIPSSYLLERICSKAFNESFSRLFSVVDFFSSMTTFGPGPLFRLRAMSAYPSPDSRRSAYIS